MRAFLGIAPDAFIIRGASACEPHYRTHRDVPSLAIAILLAHFNRAVDPDYWQ
jgi:hypothetical protein